MKLLPSFSSLSDKKLKEVLEEKGIHLTIEEARKIEQVLHRPPSLTEAILWGIQGSEHCSYKSSRKYLKLLPTKAPNVILGPGEDSGIVEIARTKNDRYGIIVSHESHNHPSQIVPFEGAATGVGGCIRDVVCMGGKVLGSMDPLRFGGLQHDHTRQIAQGVVMGIGGYGNPIGVPSLGGDVYCDEGYNDNCLVNVVAVGLVKESHIIHSFVPKTAAQERWDIVIVGKPTDFSGMGGASFSSGGLDENEKEKNKGAVQEPNPFLKRHLMMSTYELFQILQQKKLIAQVSFKDMGAGGITCSTVEQVAKAGLGAEIDLEKVHVALDNLSPWVIACSETQERFTWMCHPDLTSMILDHYNKKWDLPSVSENARASVIGKVTEGSFILRYFGEEFVHASAQSITQALQYNRPFTPDKKNLTEPKLNEPKNYSSILLQLLGSENIACRKAVYERYDKQVQGYVAIEAGEADASVLVPLLDEKIDEKLKKTGAAFSTDGNPRYGLISPFYGALNATLESMRNVAAVGAYPQAITNCLNYGNPEKPEQMWELKEGIAGITKACEAMKLKNHPDFPTPVISGNVSLYNESKNGHIPPSAIICCIGKIDDYTKAITLQLKNSGNFLYLLGVRKNELGGSEYYRLSGKLGANVPKPDLKEAQKEIYTLVDAVAAGAIQAAHDISEGGLAVTLAEMAFGHRGEGTIGVDVDLSKIPEIDLQPHIKLFSETGGFVLEVNPAQQQKFLEICQKYHLEPFLIGKTIKNPLLLFKHAKKLLFELDLKKAAYAWLHGLREKISMY